MPKDKGRLSTLDLKQFLYVKRNTRQRISDFRCERKIRKVRRPYKNKGGNSSASSD